MALYLLRWIETIYLYDKATEDAQPIQRRTAMWTIFLILTSFTIGTVFAYPA
jgi:hypothetical protein